MQKNRHAQNEACQQSDMQKVGIFVKSQKGRMNEGVVRITIGRPEDNDRVLENLAI